MQSRVTKSNLLQVQRSAHVSFTKPLVYDSRIPYTALQELFRTCGQEFDAIGMY